MAMEECSSTYTGVEGERELVRAKHADFKGWSFHGRKHNAVIWPHSTWQVTVHPATRTHCTMPHTYPNTTYTGAEGERESLGGQNGRISKGDPSREVMQCRGSNPTCGSYPNGLLFISQIHTLDYATHIPQSSCCIKKTCFSRYLSSSCKFRQVEDRPFSPTRAKGLLPT